MHGYLSGQSLTWVLYKLERNAYRKVWPADSVNCLAARSFIDRPDSVFARVSGSLEGPPVFVNCHRPA